VKIGLFSKNNFTKLAAVLMRLEALLHFAHVSSLLATKTVV